MSNHLKSNACVTFPCDSFTFINLFNLFTAKKKKTRSRNCFLPCPFDEVWQVIEQAEGVERVADDLCDGPGCDKQQHAVLTLHLQRHTHTSGDGRETG